MGTTQTAELDEKRLVKIPEAVRITSLSRSSIYEAMDAGRLAYHRFGRARRIALDDLHKFIESARMGGENAGCTTHD